MLLRKLFWSPDLVEWITSATSKSVFAGFNLVIKRKNASPVILVKVPWDYSGCGSLAILTKI